MQAFYPGLIKALSLPRLHSYRDGASSILNVNILSRYVHNMHVAAALSTALHLLEVSLRNSMQAGLSRVLGRPDWYDLPVICATRTQMDQLATARYNLKKASKIETPDRIVAELPFGYWTGLFASPFEHSLWRMHSCLLAEIFPRSRKKNRTRSDMSNKLQRMRALRNRVAHWERVTHLPNLHKDYEILKELLKVTNPAAHEFLSGCDTFEESFTSSQRHRASVCAFSGFDFEEVRLV